MDMDRRAPAGARRVGCRLCIEANGHLHLAATCLRANCHSPAGHGYRHLSRRSRERRHADADGYAAGNGHASRHADIDADRHIAAHADAHVDAAAHRHAAAHVDATSHCNAASHCNAGPLAPCRT
jgi:hypothetical protein